MNLNILLKSVSFFLGTLLPLPVFYNLKKAEFIVHKVSKLIQPLSNSTYDPIVPIGFFVLFVVVLLLPFVPKTKIRKTSNIYWAILLFFCFFSIAVGSITSFGRVLSLIYPYLLLFILYYLCSSEWVLTYLLRGYLISLLTFVNLHFAMYLFYRFIDISLDYYWHWSSSFWGYEIYQAFVSYSALLSFLACSIFIFVINSKDKFKFILLSLLSGIIFCVIALGFRKGVYVDLCIMLLTMIFYQKKLDIKIFSVRSFISLACIGSVCYFFIRLLLIYRGSNANLLHSRSCTIMFFNDLANTPLIKIIFGNFGNPVPWGPYHNLFMDFIMSIGLVGLAIFLLSFGYCINLLWTIIKQIFPNIYQAGKVDANVKAWLTFAICSFIGGNMYNTDFQLPYYVINIAFISLCYFYLYKRPEANKIEIPLSKN